MKSYDLVGQVFSRLTVISYYGSSKKEGNTKSRGALWSCQCKCGNIIITLAHSLRSGHTRSCGCLQKDTITAISVAKTGPANNFWKGGAPIKDAHGYRLLKAKDHPYARKIGYVNEHRLVMEKILGRYLHPDETVHHKNGIRDDNRPENLELRAGKHGKGQTVEDLVIWAKEILQRYGSL